MSNLVGNPADRFSYDEAHFIFSIRHVCSAMVSMGTISDSQCVARVTSSCFQRTLIKRRGRRFIQRYGKLEQHFMKTCFLHTDNAETKQISCMVTAQLVSAFFHFIS